MQRDVAVPWAASVAAWCLGSGHSGNGNGNGGGGGECDTRGHIAKVGRGDDGVDDDKVRVCAADNAGTDATAE